jgi:hypothetical protein
VASYHVTSSQPYTIVSLTLPGFLQESDLGTDGVHPTTDGYRKVVAVRAAAIASARFQNLLQEPENTGVSDDSEGSDNTCDKVPGRADGPHQIQNGYGFDDGPYKHAGTKMSLSTKPWHYGGFDLDAGLKKIQYAKHWRSKGGCGRYGDLGPGL